MGKTKVVSISIILFFIVIAIPINYFTPLHSDDFYFSMLGIEFSPHWEQYLSWSGRVVATYISSLLLALKNKVLIAIIQSIGLAGLLYFISQIPNKISNASFKSVVFLFIGVLYWLYQPHLGQSTFWIVGSANYLWTNLLICVYLLFLLDYYFNGKFSYFIFLFALISGCTNENTAPLIVCITVFLFLIKSYFDKKIDVKLLSTSVFNSIGCAVLLFSPGNKVRMQRIEDWEGLKWSQFSIVDKINRFDSNYWEFLKVPVLILFFIYVVLWLFKTVKLLNKGNKLSFFAISVIFFLSSLISDYMMFMSPAYPARSVSGPFFFLLLAISFAFFDLSKIIQNSKKIKWMFFLFLGILIFLFGVLYCKNIYPFYKEAYHQNLVQLEIIKKQQEEKVAEAKVPGIHFEEDYGWRIFFDTYVEPSALAEYYGFKKFEYFKVDYDLHKINNDETLKQNIHLRTKGGLRRIAYYQHRNNTFFSFELSESELASIKENDRMFFHIKDIYGDSYNFDINEIAPVYVLDKYFIFKRIPIKLNRIQSVNFGYFDANNWDFRYVDITIPIKKDK